MKKLFMLLALMLVLVTAACGNNEADADNGNKEKTNGADNGNAVEEMDEDELKASTLENYLNMVKSVRIDQKQINAYLGELANEEADPTALETLKADAIAAAENAATTLEGFTLENLDEETTTTFETTLADLKAAYDAYVTAFNADEVDVTAAEEKITAANDHLVPVFENVGLATPNIAAEIN
ncbi:hypothetical protein NC661_19425 [Aquibacillus koreensis]|uniref:Lipoprotein n=1 Tax=Aquibacillus koreensis TaxID=279446 RepID=A0A9X4AJS1_9BACI|nr:hypothetical protein [Aquibacillus koreensis]MCT2535362.1 hypothetical protein [Aquibacillus koreensis]MDC3422527.1 hypothetical protein [Aquibacillus koreensis]